MNDFDSSDIENVVIGTVRTLGVSGTIYHNRPKATTSEKEDFVVVSVSGGVEDRAALGECTVLISLFARDVQQEKNWKKLSVMYKKITAGFPHGEGRYIYDGEPRVLGDVPDDYGFHARVMELRVLIRATE